MSVNMPRYWTPHQLGGEWIIDPNTGRWRWVPGELPDAEDMGPGGFDSFFWDQSGKNIYNAPGRTDAQVGQASWGLGGHNIGQEQYNLNAKLHRATIRPEEAQMMYDAVVGPGLEGVPGNTALETTVLAGLEQIGYRNTHSHGPPVFVMIRDNDVNHNGGYVIETRTMLPDGTYDRTVEVVGLDDPRIQHYSQKEVAGHMIQTSPKGLHIEYPELEQRRRGPQEEPAPEPPPTGVEAAKDLGADDFPGSDHPWGLPDEYYDAVDAAPTYEYDDAGNLLPAQTLPEENTGQFSEEERTSELHGGPEPPPAIEDEDEFVPPANAYGHHFYANNPYYQQYLREIGY